MRGTERGEVQAGAGEESPEEGGPVLHPLEPSLDQRSQLRGVAFGQVGDRDARRIDPLFDVLIAG